MIDDRELTITFHVNTDPEQSSVDVEIEEMVPAVAKRLVFSGTDYETFEEALIAVGENITVPQD